MKVNILVILVSSNLDLFICITIQNTKTQKTHLHVFPNTGMGFGPGTSVYGLYSTTVDFS